MCIPVYEYTPPHPCRTNQVDNELFTSCTSQQSPNTASQYSLGLLGSGLLVGLTLGADSDVTGVGAGLAESGEGSKLLLLGGDSTGLLGLVDGGEGGEVAGDVGLEVLALGVARLGLAVDTGEDDKTLAVGGQALDVELLALLRLGAAAVVDNDAKALGLLPGDASKLELGKGESAALTDADVVALGGAANGGAETLEGSGTRSKSLLGAGSAARLLLAGLVELETVRNLSQLGDGASIRTQVLTRLCQSLWKWFFCSWLLCLTILLLDVGRGGEMEV